MSALRVLVNGARGRMGRAIIQCADEIPDLQIGATVDEDGDFAASLAQCDVAIDFSHHTVTAPVAKQCAAACKPLVIGTTGHADGELAEINAAAATIPIVLAPNFSIGVNTLFWLTHHAAKILGESFDMEVVEMHHRMKKDAPSGTARRLGEILAATRGLQYDGDTRHGRHGIVGERASGEIGMHAIRGGDVVGDHTVIFAGQGERVELTHKASSRDTFARGALRAAQWVCSKGPGLYDMQDVLGLR